MTTQPITVFLADDHPIVAEGIKALLLPFNEFQFVGHASDGQDLMRQLSDLKVQVLLLDLNMPGDDFFVNIKYLRKQHPWIRILAFTGYDNPSLAKSVIDAGAQGFLVKSCKPSQILEAIRVLRNGEQYLPEILRQNETPAESASTSPPPVRDDFRKRLSLSKREQEILVFISKGFTSQRIAQALFISKYTVETHRKNILRKLDLNSSTELVKFAIQQGLIQ